MDKKYPIIDFINCFFAVKNHNYFFTYKDIILSFAEKPNLFYIANKYNISVLQVHDIVREYNLGQLNRRVFEISKEIK
tara:strand:+ start:1124 stop:1357 length:234 start_codon:yes stop_codon:yes gene_type:complete